MYLDHPKMNDEILIWHVKVFSYLNTQQHDDIFLYESIRKEKWIPNTQVVVHDKLLVSIMLRGMCRLHPYAIRTHKQI